MSKGNLFFAIRLGTSSFEKHWEALYSEAQRHFPDLNVTHPADLHITLIYIGSEWTLETRPVFREISQLPPPERMTLTPSFECIGKGNKVLALTLHFTLARLKRSARRKQGLLGLFECWIQSRLDLNSNKITLSPDSKIEALFSVASGAQLPHMLRRFIQSQSI